MARLLDDALSEYMELGSAVVSGVPLTMACWFRTDSDTLNQALVTLNVSGGAHRLSLFAGGGLAGDPVGAGTQSGQAVSSTSYSANTWHHAAAVYRANNDRSAYLDGGGRGDQTSLVNQVGLNRTTIGARWATTLGLFLSGAVAEIGIWDVALSDAEVLSLARGFAPPLVRPVSLITYWPLIGRSSPEPDRHGGNALTAAGARFDHPRILYAL